MKYRNILFAGLCLLCVLSGWCFYQSAKRCAAETATRISTVPAEWQVIDEIRIVHHHDRIADHVMRTPGATFAHTKACNGIRDDKTYGASYYYVCGPRKELELHARR